MEGEIRAHDVVADEPAFFRLLDSDLQAAEGKRVLGPHVQIALAGSDSVRADGHPLEHGVRIPLKHGAIHECPRVALVAVADEVLDPVGRGCGRGEAPLKTGGEPGSTSATQAGLGDLFHDLRRRHLGEDLVQGLVAVGLKIVVDVLGAYESHVAQGELLLRREEGIVLSRPFVGEDQPLLDDLSIDDVPLDDLLHHGRRHLAVGDRP